MPEYWQIILNIATQIILVEVPKFLNSSRKYGAEKKEKVMEWLRERGPQHLSEDEKSELVEHILAILKILKVID